MNAGKLWAPAILLLLLLACQCTPARQAIKTHSSSFQVCDVKKSTDLLEAIPFQRIVEEKLIQEKAWKERADLIRSDSTIDEAEKVDKYYNKNYQHPGSVERALEALPKNQPELIKPSFHPFVEAVHTAYAEHYPITISPDMIWLLITQGFAMHVNQHPEAMREYFVDFQGKKNLEISRNNFVKGSPNNDWEGVFEEFGQLIETHTGKGLLQVISAEFSTSTSVEKAAFQITLMDAMKSYFTYAMATLCGIPEITIEGTVSDWETIEIKTQELSRYGLQGWVEELMPVLQEFTKSARGNADPEFWRSFYKLDDFGSGSTEITGWILKFFPYKDLSGQIAPFAGFLKKGTNLRAETHNFPSGMCSADLIWNNNGNYIKMELVSGFMGIRQDSSTLSLRPVISWAVLERKDKPTQDEIETYLEGGDRKFRKSQKQR
jgi:hypothetical protein